MSKNGIELIKAEIRVPERCFRYQEMLQELLLYSSGRALLSKLIRDSVVLFSVDKKFTAFPSTITSKF